jgi:hypothetical protein
LKKVFKIGIYLGAYTKVGENTLHYVEGIKEIKATQAVRKILMIVLNINFQDVGEKRIS